MTVSSNTSTATFIGNGATVFPLPFRFFDNDDLRVFRIDPATGQATMQALGVDYSLSGAGEPEVDGSPVSILTLASPLTLGGPSLYVERIMSIEQPTDIVNQGRFFPEVHEDAFDRLTMLIQQADAAGRGAIRVAVGDPEPNRLPPAASRANLLMSFDSNGNPITVAPSSGDSADLAIDLANSSDPNKGAAMIGYQGQTVADTLEHRKRGISVLDYGADPTGSIASDAAFAAATAAAKAANTFVYGEGVFRFTGKYVINAQCDFSQADFKFYGQPALAVEVSTGSAANPLDSLRGMRFKLPRLIENVDKPGVGWAGAGIGLRTVNLNQCWVDAGTIRGFGTGLLNTSYGVAQGSAYTTFAVLHFDNNRVNHHMIAGDANGWFNQNLFIGGRYSHNSSEGTNVAGTRHIKIDKSAFVINSNVWINSSVEGNTPEYHVENCGQHNCFQQCRWESFPSKVLYNGDTAQQATDNLIIGGYIASEIVFTYTLSGPATGNFNRVIANRESLETLSTGHIYMNAAGDDSPVFRIQQAAQRPENATLTDYAVRQTAQTHRGKLGADTFDRVLINYSTPRITFGSGTATQDVGVIRASANSLQLLSGVQVVPSADNAVSMGNGSLRWSVIFAGTGAINTSDERYKQQIRPLLDPEKAVAVRLKGLLRAFKFNDAVAAKGDNARIHVGIIAQDVKLAFEAEGLVAEDYAVLCYDQWEAQPAQLTEDGDILVPAIKAGDRYGVRYDELLAFILAAL